MKQATEPITINKIGIRIHLPPDLFTLVADLTWVNDESFNDILIKIIEEYFKHPERLR